jgi:pimeloyl-ACP methyl ester carboxylesterase
VPSAGSIFASKSGRILSGIEASVKDMTTYVLVAGNWIGAWAWHAVTDSLRANGHEVYPLSLTGLAERAHLASRETDLDTHVTDVVNLLRYEDLSDVVLVGHSYGGIVVTGAADRVPERVRHLVYVDSGPLPDGVAQADFGGPEDRARNEALVQEAGDGWLLPPPPWADLAAGVDGIDGEVLAALAERSVPHPWAAAAQPARLTGSWERLPRLGILSSFTVAQVRELAAVAPMFRHMDGGKWTFEELPTWHWPMFSRPKELAAILGRL